MNTMLKKEIRLSSLLLTYLFIGFAFMTLLPGYPILCSVFFITLGIFQSFQYARESQDILYSALLPVSRKDIVKGKYQFTILIELCGFLIMVLLTVLRMTLFSNSPVYRQNPLMNANLFFLGTALLMFALFNAIFLGGFFHTAYKLGKPFILYNIAAFTVIGIAEALHHFPGLGALNAFGSDHLGLQLILLTAGVLLYIFITYLSYRKACADFDKIDL